MTTAPRNTLKARLKAGETTRGAWINFHADAVTEMAGHSGADWVLIDGEHAPYNPDGLLRQIRVLAGTPADAMVRVPTDEAWILKQVLDLGVQSIMVPVVETAAQAEAIVRACRYPPHGVRGVGPAVSRAGGYGRLSDYVQDANDEICIILQAETGKALDNLEAMAAVDGVDGIFIGPADLAASLGTGPEAVAAAIEEALARIKATGVAPGIMASRATRDHYEALGSRVTTVACDTKLMLAGLSEAFAP